MEIFFLSASCVLLYLYLLPLVNMKFNFYEYYNREVNEWLFRWHESYIQTLAIVEVGMHIAYWSTLVGTGLSVEERFAFYQVICCLSIINYAILIPSHMVGKSDRQKKQWCSALTAIVSLLVGASAAVNYYAY